METKKKLEIVGVSVAAIVLARHFVSKYQDTLQYLTYMFGREEKFKSLYLSCKTKSLFAKGEKRIYLEKEAERYRRKAAWYLERLDKKKNNNNI